MADIHINIGPAVGADVYTKTAADAKYLLNTTDSLTGNLTITGSTTTGNLTLSSGSVTDSGGAISFGNENLTTTGTLASGNITATGTVTVNASANTGVTITDGTVSVFNVTSGGTSGAFGTSTNHDMSIWSNNSRRLSIKSNGVVEIAGDTLRIQNYKTPASATATGVKGDIVQDASYIYVCVATNAWKRTAIATW